MHVPSTRIVALIAAIAATIAPSPRAPAQGVVKIFNAIRADEPAEKGDKVPPEFLKPLINNELSFIKRVCGTTEDQMKEVVSAAQLAYQEMGDIVANKNGRVVLANNLRVRGPNNEVLTQNPYTRVRKDAAKYLEPILPKEQWNRYLEESKLRVEFEQQAAIEISIGLIDNHLVLTDPQRAQLTKELLKSWKNVDIQQMQMYLYNPQYVPQVPFASLSKTLTPSQLKVWQGLNSTNFSVHLGHQPLQVLNEDWIK